jgi:hypothetical protein
MEEGGFVTADVTDGIGILQLTHHIAMVHPIAGNNAGAVPPGPRKLKVKPPDIDIGVTNEKHQFYVQRWATFKTSTGITGDELRGQLMDTTSEKLRYAMFQDDRDIETRDEATILASIKKLAVKSENVMISRITLHGIQQEADENIRNFAARVKGQADLCNLVVRCTCGEVVRYTDQIVRDIIMRGLHDQDHQCDVLGHHDQNMTLDAILTLLETKETGRRTQASILSETGGLGKSAYKKADRTDPAKQQQEDKTVKCNNCGKVGHRANRILKDSTANRRKNCPTFHNKCDKCKKCATSVQGQESPGPRHQGEGDGGDKGVGARD